MGSSPRQREDNPQLSAAASADPLFAKRFEKTKAMVRSNRGGSSDRRGWLAATKKKCGKNSDEPKKPPSAFFLFLEDFRLEYKLEHPNVKVSSVISAAGGDRWRAMSDEDKASYCAMAEHHRAEYAKAMDAYNNPREPDQHEVAHEVEPANVMYNQGEIGQHEVEHDGAGAAADHAVDPGDVMWNGDDNFEPGNGDDNFILQPFHDGFLVMPAPAESMVTSITASGPEMSSAASALSAPVLAYSPASVPSKHRGMGQC